MFWAQTNWWWWWWNDDELKQQIIILDKSWLFMFTELKKDFQMISDEMMKLDVLKKHNNKKLNWISYNSFSKV